MQQNSILLPCAAMAAITAAVWTRMYFDRVGELRARRIHPQALATARQAAETLKNVQAADNFRNLFEVPVLFYVLCLSLFAAQAVSPPFLAGAWLFVLLRAAHSWIHCTYNRVMHRFTVYAASSLLLFLMWGAFVVRLLTA